RQPAGGGVIAVVLAAERVYEEERRPCSERLDRHQRRPGGAGLFVGLFVGAWGREDGLAFPDWQDYLPRRAGMARAQTLHGPPVMRPRPVGEGDPEPAISHDAAHLQPMG